MDFLITESQFNYLVENKDTDIIEKNISELESFSKKIYCITINKLYIFY